jgi:RNA polymerase sigma-70 factor (ECF subfamily)
MENPQELESVIAGVRANDQDALERLFAQHRDYLRQVVRLRIDPNTQKRVDVSDIVQDAQVEALRRVEEFAANPVMPVRLWLRQIACDRLVMAQRKHVGAARRSVKRELCLPEDMSVTIARQLVAGIPSPSAAATRKELSAKLRSAVAELDEDDREIILLQAFEGLNSTESAEVLGIEPATARKRYGRALRRLQQKLVEQGLGASQL